MPRAKKAKVEKAEVVESGEIVEPEPPKPFLFEPPQPAEPISCERQWSSAKEHQMVLRAIAVDAGKRWKQKVRESARLEKAWKAASLRRNAKYAVWEKQRKEGRGKKHLDVWEKMDEEDARVAAKQTEWLLGKVKEHLAQNTATEAKLACRDATIRELRAKLAKRARG